MFNVPPYRVPQVAAMGGTVAFDPLALSPSHWYAGRDATALYTDAGTTLVSADGDAVYRVGDKSGNGRNADQSTLGNRALYKTGIQNGLSVLRTDSTDFYSISSNALSGDFTIFWVSNLTVLGVGLIGNASSSVRISVPGAIRFKQATDTLVTTSSFVTGAWHIGAIRRSSGALTGYKNGTDITTGSPTNSETLTIDSLFSAQSLAIWQGDTGEVIVFPSALASGDMTSMWTYLNGLWAVY